MAVVSILSSGSTKGHKPLKNVLDYCMQEAKTLKDGRKLVSGIDCLPETAYSEMMATKKYHGKMGGREYYHILQSFSPDEDISPEKAHEIAMEFAEKQFKGFEVVVATHVDRDHIHSHIVLNSVNHENGKKYHSDKNNIPRLRKASDEICMKYGLSVIEDKEKNLRQMGTREYRAATKGESWKINLMATINLAMTKAKTKDEYLKFMEDLGYQVTWTDSRKYITYTTPDNMKCRDNRLHMSKYTKEAMDNEFDIRRKINERIRASTAESYQGEGSDSLRDDLGRELEIDNRDDAATVGSSEQTRRIDPVSSDGQTVGELYRSSRGHTHPSRREMDEAIDVRSREDTERSGEPIEDDGEGIPITGWEAERATCYGIGQSQDGSGTTDDQLRRQALQANNNPMPAYDVVIGSARLVGNLQDIVSPDPAPVPDMTSKPAGMDRKEWQKIAEKKEALGIRMGGM